MKLRSLIYTVGVVSMLIFAIGTAALAWCDAVSAGLLA